MLSSGLGPTGPRKLYFMFLLSDTIHQPNNAIGVTMARALSATAIATNKRLSHHSLSCASPFLTPLGRVTVRIRFEGVGNKVAHSS